MTALAPTVESFFTGYLIGQRGASAHTIASYRDTLRLLFRYVHERTGIRPSDLDVADLDAETVSGFLATLEQARHNSGQTRNLRLAAIHSLFRHAALGTPSTPAHRPGPGHPAAQAVPPDGRLSDRRRGRGAAGRPGPRDLDRAPRPPPDARHAH